MGNFVCIGYDIRVWPPEGYVTTDGTEWERNDALFEKITHSITYENNFQLIKIDKKEKLNEVVSTVIHMENVALVSFEIPSIVFYASQKKMGKSSENIAPDDTWALLGYDVADIDGFFSILHMEAMPNKRRHLFGEDELAESLIVAQAANLLVPSHSPFVTIRIKKLVNS